MAMRLITAECEWIVAWYCHGEIWQTIAECPNESDAQEIADMWNTAMGNRARANGEDYKVFHRDAFAVIE